MICVSIEKLDARSVAATLARWYLRQAARQGKTISRVEAYEAAMAALYFFPVGTAGTAGTTCAPLLPPEN